MLVYLLIPSIDEYTVFTPANDRANLIVGLIGRLIQGIEARIRLLVITEIKNIGINIWQYKNN